MDDNDMQACAHQQELEIQEQNYYAFIFPIQRVYHFSRVNNSDKWGEYDGME